MYAGSWSTAAAGAGLEAFRPADLLAGFPAVDAAVLVAGRVAGEAAAFSADGVASADVPAEAFSPRRRLRARTASGC
jgi:hypothetical protein